MKKRRTAFRLFKAVAVVALLVVMIMVPHMFIPQISDSLSISSHTPYQPEMVAHRGLSGLAPQNSLAAIELAVEYGYDGCEFDIHTTKDGEWVVIHDDTVDAMTDGTGAIDDYTLEEIRKLRIDSGNGIENYENLRIPTLREVLTVLDGTETYPVIEIKKCDKKLIPEFFEILEEFKLTEKSKIISFEREYLEIYRSVDEDADMMLLTHIITEDDVRWCIANGVNTVNFRYINLYKSLKGRKLALENGIRLAAWTVDNTVYKDVMVLFGAEAITTNKLIIKK